MALTDKLTNIADAIRTKAGTSARLTLDDMPTAIANIPSGSSDVPFFLSGLNAIKVDSYSESWNLADTSFAIGSSASTSATSIKATMSNRYQSPTYAFNNKDIIVAQQVIVAPTYSSSASNKAKQIYFAYTHLTAISKRPTSDTSGKTARQVFYIQHPMLKYYNSSGVLTRGSASYGMYATPSAATVSSSTASSMIVRVSSPTLYYRASSTYLSTTNIKLITACTWDWKVDVFAVDDFSSFANGINTLADYMMTNGSVMNL